MITVTVEKAFVERCVHALATGESLTLDPQQWNGNQAITLAACCIAFVFRYGLSTPLPSVPHRLPENDELAQIEASRQRLDLQAALDVIRNVALGCLNDNWDERLGPVTQFLISGEFSEVIVQAYPRQNSGIQRWYR